MKRRTVSDGQRERIAHRRALWCVGRSAYRSNLYATPAILGRHVVVFLSLNVFKTNERNDLYKALRQIREVPATAKILLDFTNLSTIKISAVLVLYAHLEVLLKSRKHIRVSWHKPRDEILDQKLSELGLWALLGEDYRVLPGVIPICSISHREKDEGTNKALRDAITYAKNAIASCSINDDVDENDVTYGAISESFTNVWQHAYSEEFVLRYSTLNDSSRVKKWWIALHHIDQELYMAVYDIGAGIPTSTRSKKWYTSLAGELSALLGGKNPDCNDIQTALAYGASRYKEQGRGNGLPTIKKFVEINPNGELYIMSGKGIYKYRSTDQAEQWTSVDNAYPGTLIQWNIALAEGGGNSNDE